MDNLTPCSINPTIIGLLATDAGQRGLTEQEFKDKFDQFGKLFVEYFNNTHLLDIKTKVEASILTPIYGEQLAKNWDWTNPVNQRVITSKVVTTTPEYLVDMWRGTNMTFTVSSGYVNITSSQITASKRIQQMFESIYKLEAGKTYTLSIKAKCNAISGSVILRPCTSAQSGIVPSSQQQLTQSADYQYYKCTFTPSSDVIGFGIEILASNTANDYFNIDIQAWKLERGGANTLPNDAFMDFGGSLNNCQRHQSKIPSGEKIRAVGYQANYIDFFIPLAVPLRANPTLPTANMAVYTVPGVTQTGFTFAVVGDCTNSNGVMIRATKTSHGLTDGYLNFSADSMLDSNL